MGKRKKTLYFKELNNIIFISFFLKTHEVDLRSDIGMQLKREMLIRLAKKDTDMYPDDKEKQETIFNRYKEFVIPVTGRFLKFSF